MTTDVVIPVYNQLELVSQCIDGLLSQDDVGRIIVVDDASIESALVHYLMEIAAAGKIFLTRMEKNSGFVDAANLGMEQVETEYGVIVNSDTMPVRDNSLTELVMRLHQYRFHVSGPKLLFMDNVEYGARGTIQHAGVGFNRDGVPYHPFMHLHRHTRAANVTKDVSAVTGAVLAVRMEVWRSVGGFDKMFAPGVYEDVDFCLRSGRVLYNPRSEWLHKMHGSQGNGVDLFENEAAHLDLLLRRWNPVCDEELYYGV